MKINDRPSAGMPVIFYPESARERVATPPAGTALARVPGYACRATSEMGEVPPIYVSETGTRVNEKETSHFRHCRTSCSQNGVVSLAYAGNPLRPGNSTF